MLLCFCCCIVCIILFIFHNFKASKRYYKDIKKLSFTMTSQNNLNRDLTCVLFPGVVKNEEKAIECLGGIRSISQSYSSQGKQRLGVTFKPDNPMVAKAYADLTPSPGVLLKVKVKKTNTKDGIKREVVSTEVAGRVKSIFKFDSMMDFQYLPIHRNGPGSSMQCFEENLIPSGTDSVNFMAQQIPLHLVPSTFTKYDKPLPYSYEKSEKKANTKNVELMDDDVHHKIRSERTAPNNLYSFNLTEQYPTEPHQIFRDRVFKRDRNALSLSAEYEAIKKIFEERPICSSTYLRYRTGIKTSIQKLVLNAIAYYFSNGPWRVQWVKYGYDPRKDPESRIYQTLDFRVSHSVVSSLNLNSRRGFNIDTCTKGEHERMAIFRPGRLPIQRQNFFQLCDVLLPEVQELISQPPPPGYLCHERRGWLTPAALDACREHMFHDIRKIIHATNALSKLDVKPTSSDEESTQEDDVIASEADVTMNT